jgi:hypothetical protein
MQLAPNTRAALTTPPYNIPSQAWQKKINEGSS